MAAMTLRMDPPTVADGVLDGAVSRWRVARQALAAHRSRQPGIEDLAGWQATRDDPRTAAEAAQAEWTRLDDGLADRVDRRRDYLLDALEMMAEATARKLAAAERRLAAHRASMPAITDGPSASNDWQTVTEALARETSALRTGRDRLARLRAEIDAEAAEAP